MKLAWNLGCVVLKADISRETLSVQAIPAVAWRRVCGLAICLLVPIAGYPAQMSAKLRACGEAAAIWWDGRQVAFYELDANPAIAACEAAAEASPDDRYSWALLPQALSRAERHTEAVR